MATYQTSDYDTENQYDWTRIQYTIEDDVILSTRTLYDAGYEVFGIYEEGILTSEFYVNTLEALGFDNRSIEYSSDGEITYRGTVYPDALRVSETFENGVRMETTLIDGFFGDGVKPWNEISFTHDEAGNIVTQTTKPNSGPIQVDTFEQGVREMVYDFAQEKTWASIETVYAEDGNRSERTITYDTGISRQEFYEEGARVRLIQTDASTNDGFGEKNWNRIETLYDANGDVSERLTNLDNGIVKTDTFEGGVRVNMVQEDTANAKNWDTIVNDYSEGQIATKTVTFDTGDISVTQYTDGLRTQLLQYDGDESSAWLVRVIDYAEDGSREITKYTSVEEIPAEVLDTFPALAPPVEPPVELTAHVLDFNDGIRLNDGESVLDNTFILDVSQGENNIQGILFAHEYDGATTSDADKEAFNSWGSTIGFTKADGEEFDFSSLSLANTANSDTQYVPEYKWANTVTINGYNDGVIVETIDVDLTFDHVTETLNWEDLDRIEFVASGGGITNDHVENAGWFSMDDLVFLA